ncbi:MAG: transcriptional activator NhaR [Phycisphaerales bacterium]
MNPERLNYNHLRCFWATAREGSIARACDVLGLTQPTISKQIGELEDTIGEALFRRVGRRLVLTDLGRTVQGYADDIFTLGRELTDAIDGATSGRPVRLRVGITDAVPKLLTRRVLEPALAIQTPVRLVCHEGERDHLLSELAIAHLDLVLSDAAPPQGLRPKAHHRLLVDSPVALFGVPALEDAAKQLDGAPILLPTERTQLRRALDAWCDEQRIAFRVVGEFDDSALIKAFGEGGHALFAAPIEVSDLICAHYGVRQYRILEGLRERVYAITAERRTTHPAIHAIMPED